MNKFFVTAYVISVSLMILAGPTTAAVDAERQAAVTAPRAKATATKVTGEGETGKKLFISYGCWQCHGFEGQGGAAGPRLAPAPLPFTAFSRIVRRPPNQMPAYPAKLVSDSDLTLIHAYLTSRPAPPQNIPLLRR